MITDIPDYLNSLMLRKLTELGKRITKQYADPTEAPADFDLHADFDMAIQMWSLVQMLIEMTGKRKSFHFYTVEILDNEGLRDTIDQYLLEEKNLLTRYFERDELMVKQLKLYGDILEV